MQKKLSRKRLFLAHPKSDIWSKNSSTQKKQKNLITKSLKLAFSLITSRDMGGEGEAPHPQIRPWYLSIKKLMLIN